MSDELIIDGQPYIGAKTASSKYGFSRDHVTRLCRTSKIEARLIDNTWYLKEDSLQSFLVALDRRRDEQAASLRSARKREYKDASLNDSPRAFSPTRTRPTKSLLFRRVVGVASAPVAGVLATLIFFGSAVALITPARNGVILLPRYLATFAQTHALAPLTSFANSIERGQRRGEVAAADAAGQQTGGFAVPLLGRPLAAATGTPDHIASSIIQRANFASPAFLQINVPLQLHSTLAADGAATFSGALSAGTGTFSRSLIALGGILTQGADANLGQGRIFASNIPTSIVSSVHAGDNVTITGPANSPTISVSIPASKPVYIGGGGGGGGGGITSFTAGAGLSGGKITSNGTIAVDFTGAYDWSALQTFSAGLDVTSLSTSTIEGGLSVANFDVTSGTSTFANGLSIASGCFAINGTCISAGSGSGIASIGNGIATTSDTSILFSTSTASFNGLTLGTLITAGASSLSFAPSISGMLGIGGGGTGSTTLSGILVGNGASPLNTLSYSGPLSLSGSTLTITKADSSTDGYLSSNDWNLFNNKVSSSSLDIYFAGNQNWQLTSNIFGQSALAPTTTQNIAINGTGTSTFVGGLESWKLISAPYFNATSTATSTFNGGVNLLALNITGTATSTAANGFDIASGCFAINGTCLSVTGLGGLASVSATYPITGDGTSGNPLILAFGTTTTNSWSALQTFANASSTFTTLGTTWLSGITNSLVAADETGKLIASSTIGANLLTGTLGIANGGTASTTLGGILTGNGTGAITSATISGPLAFSANTLSITKSDATHDGYLAQGDWTLFNNKISSSSLSAVFPLAYNSATGVFTTAFSTTTTNTFSGTNTFNGNVTLTNATATTFAITALGIPAGAVLAVNPNGTIVATTTAQGTVTNVATDATLSGGPITTTGTLGLNLAHSNAWSALQLFTAGASTTILSISNGFATTTLLGAATSSFGAGINTTALNLTGATSTAANGWNLNGGCFAIQGTCLSATGLGGLSQVTADYPLLGLGTAGSHLKVDFSTTTANDWNKLQTFTNSSSTLATFSGSTWLTGAGLQNALLSTDQNGLLVATSTPTALSFIATNASATSSFAGGVSLKLLNITGTATSTAANGWNLNGGCFAIQGTCLSATGLGGLSQVTADYPLLGLGTAASHLSLAFGTTTNNTFSGTNTFNGNVTLTNATSTAFAITSLTGKLLATDANGNVIGTTSVGTNYLTGTLGIANGGTASTTLGGILTGNGTGAITSATISGPLAFSANTLSITKSDATHDGYLAQGDWTLFNNKISSSSLSAVFPLAYNSATGVFTTAFSTTTTNTFSGTNTFNGNVTLTNATATTFAITALGIPAGAVLAVNPNGTIVATTTAQGTVTNVATDATLSGGPITTTGTLGLNLAHSNAWSALQLFTAGASTTILSISNGFATTTLLGAATSSFGAGINTTALNLTGATSTAANGWNLNGGCFAIQGTCLSATGLGGLSQVTADYPLLGLGTAASHLSLAFGTTTNNTFSGTNTFNGNVTLTNATSTAFAITSLTGKLLATDANGNVIGTTSVGTNYLTGTLGIANGGTASTTLGGILTGNGTGAITSATISGPLAFSANTLSITKSDATHDGYLAQGDWTLFNNKISSSSLSAVFPLAYNSATGVFTTAFSTTTTNTFSGTNTFNGNVTLTNATATTFAITALGIPAGAVLAVNPNGTIVATTTAQGTVTNVATDATLSGGPITTTGTLGLNLAHSNAWSALQLFTAGASTTILSISNGFATTTLLGAATSSFGAGINTTALNLTGATSTAANGWNLNGGCFAIQGTCLSATGLGGLSQVTADYPLLGLGTAASHLSLAFGTTTNNTFSGTNTFNGNVTLTNATSTAFAITSLTGKLLATDANGNVIGTTSVGTNYLTGILAIANGGTNASSLASHMLLAFNGTSIVASSTPTAAFYLATSSIASQFPFASTTALSATTICLTGDSCRTTWPTSGSAWPFTANDSDFGTNNVNSTSTPEWFKTGVFASSTSQFVNANVWGNLTLKATSSALLATDASGNIIATTSVGANLLTGTLGVNHGGTGTTTGGVTNGVEYYNGSTFTNSTSFIFDGTNLGLGTTTPWGKLSLTGGGTGTGYGFVVANSSNNPLFTIQDNGNVGIGTTSPAGLLGVSGNVYFDNGTTTVGPNGNVNFNNDLTYQSSTGVTSINQLSVGPLNFDTDAGTISWVNLPLSSAVLGTPESFVASIATTSILTVGGIANGDGSVGNTGVLIGATSTLPYAKLHVYTDNALATSLAFLVANNASTTLFNITNMGTVGIATSSPTPLVGFAVATTSYFAANLGIGTTSPFKTLSVVGDAYFTGTATATALTATTICFTGDTCRTTWPSSSSGIWPFTANDSDFGTNNVNSTSTPEWFKTGVFASSTSQFVNLNVWGNLTLKATSSALLATDASGNIVATTTPTALSFIATNASATSTFAGGISVLALNLTGTATSTAANGWNLNGGCFAIQGSCLSAAGLGGLSSVSADYPLLGLGTAGSHLKLDFSTTTNNIWSGTNSFATTTFTGPVTLANATSTAFAITSLTGKLLSTDINGNVIGTTSIGANYIGGILAIANGGTNASSLASHMLLAFNGTSIVASSTPTAASYIATSSIASIFPFASTTALTATTICFTGDTCRTTWPSSSSGIWPFTTGLNAFGTTTQATTTVEWFKMGLFASSTSQFDFASTTALSATTICLTGDSCRTTWPTSGSAWPFTTGLSTYGTTTQATTTPFWFQGGLFASSTASIPTFAVTQSGTGAAATFLGGNVGIGTTSPYANLSLYAPSTGTNSTLFAIASSTVFGTSDLNLLTFNNRGQLIIGGDATSTLLSGVASSTQLLVMPGTTTIQEVSSISTGLSFPNSVYVQGRYAYVGDEGNDALVIFDVSNPGSPVQVSSITRGLNNPNSVSVQGRYAYVVNRSNDALVIFDVSNPAAPVQVSSITTGLSVPYSVYVQGRYAYVASQNNSSLVTFDVSNPTSPVEVSSITTGLGGPDFVYVQGRYAYVANSGNNAFVTFDMSNPAAPAEVSSITTGLSVPYSVYVQGRYAYVASNNNSALVTFDVSSPASPVKVSSITTGLNGPTSVSVQGRYAYVVSSNNSALATFDVSNPGSPVRVSFITTGLNSPLSVYVQGRYAYVVNSSGSALTTFDLGGAYIQQLEAGGIEAGTLSLRNNLFAMDGTFAGGLTVGGAFNGSFGNFLSYATTSASSALIPSALSAMSVDSNYNSISDVLSLTHAATSTNASAGFGVGLLFNNSTLCSLANCANATTTATSTARIASLTTNFSTTSPQSDLAFFTKSSSAGLTERMRLTSQGLLGIGTSTPLWALTVASSSGPQLALTSTGNSFWTMREINGNFYLASSSGATSATSSISAFSINTNGLTTLQSATTSLFFGAGLTVCQSGNVLTYDGAGHFGCAVDATGGGAWPFFANDSDFGTNNVNSTSTPEWFKTGVFASSTSQFVNANVWGNLTLKATSSALLATDSSGNIVATTTLSINQYLTGVLPVANGGTGAATLTGLLQGNGTGAITGVGGTAGEFPYFNGTNTLLATSTLFLTTTGNIGIGTTTPSGALAVASNGSSPQQTLYVSRDFTGLSTGGGAAFIGGTDSGVANSGIYVAQKVSGGGALNDVSSYMLNVVENGSSLMVVSGAGNVGIGTTTPASNLDVFSSTNALNAKNVAQLLLEGSANNIGLQLNNYQSGGRNWGIVSAGGSAGVAPSTLDFYDLTAGASRMVIDASGNVGIGTTTPDQNLSIYAATNPSLELTSNSGKEAWNIGVDASDGYKFKISSSTAPGINDRLVIDGNGNVGIANTAPIAPLSVGSTVLSSGSFGTYGAIIAGADQATAALTAAGSHRGSLLLKATGGNPGDGGALLFGANSGNDTFFAGIKTLLTDGTNNTVGDLAFSTRAANSDSALTERMRIVGTSGNVGIGTTTPWGQLSASSTSAFPTLSIAQNSTGAAAVFLGGNVGIGSTTPATNLSVSGNGYFTGGIGAGLRNTTAGTVAVSSQFLGTTADTVSAPSFSWSGDTNDGIYHPVTDALGFVTAGAEQVRINSSGFVGIGTTSPAARLEISGSSNSTGLTALTPNNMLIIDNTDTTANNTSKLFFRTNDANGAEQTAAAIDSVHTSHSAGAVSGALAFFTSNAGTIAEGMRLTAAGNVGIGTTSPQRLLQVEGSTNPAIALNASGLEDFDMAQITSAGAFLTDAAVGDTVFRGRGGKLLFGSNSTGPASTLSITAGDTGSVGIASTSPFAKLSVGQGTETYSFEVANTGSSSPSLAVGGINDNGRVYVSATTTATSSKSLVLVVGNRTNGAGTVTSFTNGNGTCYVNPTTGIPCSSDSRLKYNVNPLTTNFGLAAIDQLSPVTFNWNAESIGSATHSGFIAQQVLPILPDLISLDPNGYYGLNYAGLTPYLVKATQELDARTGGFNGSLAPTSTPSIFADINGMIGIGTTTAGSSSFPYRLNVQGAVGAEDFINISTRGSKTDINAVAANREDQILGSIASTSLFTYRYKDEPSSSPLRIGLITDSAPSDILATNQGGVDIYKLASYTFAGLKAEDRKVNALALRVDALEKAMAATSAGASSGGNGGAGSGLTLESLLASLKSMGLDIAQGSVHMLQVFADSFFVRDVYAGTLNAESVNTQNAAVGSATAPSGITMFDKATGAPYCFEIVNGAPTAAPGECVKTASTTIQTLIGTTTIATSTVPTPPTPSTQVQSPITTTSVATSTSIDSTSSTPTASTASSSPDSGQVTDAATTTTTTASPPSASTDQTSPVPVTDTSSTTDTTSASAPTTTGTPAPAAAPAASTDTTTSAPTDTSASAPATDTSGSGTPTTP